MLKGRIDKNLEVYVSLTLDDIDVLERERIIQGVMSKPVSAKAPEQEEDEEERFYYRNSVFMRRRKSKGADYLRLGPDESTFTLHVRSTFRFEGLPAKTNYWNRKSYDLSLSPWHLGLLRKGEKIVKREPSVPVNYVCVSLEQAVQKPAGPITPAQAQSL